MIKSSKYIYLNFKDENLDLPTREAKFPSIYKTIPILERCSDYLCSVAGFTIPVTAMTSPLTIKQINIRSNVLPIKETFLNVPNAIQPRIIYSYFPLQSELSSGILSVNVQNQLFNVLESNEQLINIDLYIDIIYTGLVQTLKLSSGSFVSVNLQFKRSLNYNDI